MKEELFKDLKNRYEIAKMVIEIMGENAHWYDTRLVKIMVKDNYESEGLYYVIDVRVRKLQADGYEKISIMVWDDPTDNKCMCIDAPTGDDIDEILQNIAEIIELKTLTLTEQFKDKVLDWHWLGD